ncbi:BLUF domain-containing protein [Brevundimonas sp.]
MALEQLVYISRSTSPPCAARLVAEIAAEALRHNPPNNITGALAFTDTHFVQILEGSVSSLDVLLLRLMLDARHTDLEVLDRISIADRSFLGWAMIAPVMTPVGYRQLVQLIADDNRSVAAFRDLLLTLCASHMVAGV